MSAVDKRDQDILLHFEIAVDDGGLLLTQLRQVLDRFVHTVVADIVGGRFRAQIGAITDILFGKTVPIMAANNGTGKIHVFDDGLQLAVIVLGDLAAEDNGEFIGLTDRPIGIQQSFPHPVQGGTAREDHVVAKLRLRKKQPVINPSPTAFARGKKGNQLL